MTIHEFCQEYIKALALLNKAREEGITGHQYLQIFIRFCRFKEELKRLENQ